MGSFWTAICQKCGERFDVHEGIGMTAMILRCRDCGHNRWFDLSPEILAASPWSEVGIADWDPADDTPGLVDPCKCGGAFSLKEKPRCPKCRSTKLERGENEFAACLWD